MRPIPFLALICSLLLGSATAVAEPEPEKAAPSPKREVPDYDGRGPDPSRSDGAGVWVARVLLSPLYFTSEYLLRRPLGALTVAVERADLPRKFYDFFAFGFDHKLGFAPVGLVDFGFLPSVGIYGFWDDAFTPRNALHLHYEAWPSEWLAGSINDRYRIDDHRTVQFRVAGIERPDQVFYGIGPFSLQSNQSRYTLRQLDTNAMIETRVWRSSSFQSLVGFRKVDLSHGDFQPDPSVEESVAKGVFHELPYGFDRGYEGPYARGLATFDTRRHDANTGSGVRIEAEAEEGSDVQHGPATSWVKYGATATAFVDLNDHGRVLSLTVATLFADPLGNNVNIPFTELVSLGGDKWMHGYFPGRLIDRSAAIASLEYKWPLSPWIDGTMQVAMGNVFHEHLEGFQPNLIRLSGSLGLSTVTDPPLEFLIGFGTETIEHGTQVDSFRVSLGFPRSF